MDETIQQTWRDLMKSVSAAHSANSVTLGGYLILGGLMAMYVRFLYRKCGASVSDTDSVTRIFPLLTMVTIGVIAVVQTSMALSLGLVGALSIVRFRAAIKSRGIGLPLPLYRHRLDARSWPTIDGCGFAIGIDSVHFWSAVASKGIRKQNLLLTITGDSSEYFSNGKETVLQHLDELAGRYVLQRYDLDRGQGQVRVVLQSKSSKDAAILVTQLRERLPNCEFNYVNLSSAV